MKTCHFIVVCHPRLAFKDSEVVVKQFVARRLKNAGANVCFVSDRESVHEKAQSILKTIDEGYVVITDIMNPITDLDLVRAMVESLELNNAVICVCDGAIPGTQVDMVLAAKSLVCLAEDIETSGLPLVRKRWFSQERHNNQFNLYKYKRLKIFLRILERLPDMYEMSIDEFISALVREDIFQLLAGFGEDVRLVWHNSCPHCEGMLTPLKLRMSQPFCGYLPVERPLYHECERCSLVVISPAVHEDDAAKIYDVFDKQDFVVTLNNPYHEGSTRCDFKLFAGQLPRSTRTLDIGGGMGNFSLFLKKVYPNWVITHSDHEIKQNDYLQDMGIKTRALNFLAEPIGEECYDLLTAWEVVEHIPYNRFEAVLDNIYRALPSGGFFIFSTPDFDSPLCKSFDFFGICPPFHYTVFSESWLRRYFGNSHKWEYLSPRSCSDFLDDAIMWYDYGAKTCPSFQLRATSQTLGAIFSLDTNGELRQSLLHQGIGTEIIITLRKR